MRIIFCDNGFNAKEVDFMFQEEYQAARQTGLMTSLINFEAIKRDQFEAAVARVPDGVGIESAIYRGWMLKPLQYAALYQVLLQKSIQLINDPDSYKFCHYLPENYEVIKDYTAKSSFKPLKTAFNVEDFKEQIEVFKDQPIILKDYVKSQKHYWTEACFIPNAADTEHVNQVIQNFLALQADDLNEGLVFREFVTFEALTNHTISGMPLTKEFRLFVKNAKIMSVFNYWDEGDYQNLAPSLDTFLHLLPNIKSNFFSMDIAKKVEGDWIIVELGDGQVAGLPENADKLAFYQALK